MWRYEAIQGGGALGSANPWYEQPRDLLKWDVAWWNTGVGAWSNGDNVSPPIMNDRIIHNLHTSTYESVPAVTWVNPMGDGAQVTVTGSMTLRWSGVNGVGRPVDIDVVLAFLDASSGQITPLFSNTYSKPTAAPSVNEEVLIPLSIAGPLNFDANDALILTHRGREAFGPMGMWVTMFDDIRLTLVPAPSSMALLALAGLGCVRRRRR